MLSIIECADEALPHHFRSSSRSLGPVADPEGVVFAVFEATDLENGKLSAKTFDTDDMKKNNWSLSRLRYTCLQDFQRTVVIPGILTKGACRGAVQCDVTRLRALRIKDPRTEKRRDPLKRVLCVRSVVEPGDAPGHATMGYAEWMAELSETSKRKVRAQVRLELARTFGDIRGIQEIAWPMTAVVFLRRLSAYLSRNLQSWLANGAAPARANG